MVNNISANIQSQGKKITHFISLNLAQSMEGLHHFRLVLPSTEVAPFGKNDLKQFAQSWFGQPISIEFTKENTVQNRFEGFVTAIQLERANEHENQIVLSGMGAVCLLDTAPKYRSFEDLNLASIAQKLCETTGGKMRHDLNPAFTKAIPFAVQFGMTQFEMLQRLAATYGEWCFFDGEKLVFGQKTASSKIELLLGEDLLDFQIGMEARPSKFKNWQYNAEKNEFLQGFDTNKTNLGTWGNLAADVSDQLFGQENLAVISAFSATQQEADKFSFAARQNALAATVPVSGRVSANAALRPGAIISIKQSADFDRKNVETLGDFLITNCEHHLTFEGDYVCQFRGISAEAKAQSFRHLPALGNLPLQEAVITDNEDPKSLGRVRCRFDWMPRNEQSPWLPIAAAYAGEKRGFYFIPEIDDRVTLAFENNRPDAPIVLGSWHHADAKSDIPNKQNRIKSIRTRSGNEIQFDDSEGKARIHILQKDSKNEVILSLEEEGKIRIATKGELQIVAKNIDIKAEQNLNIKAKTVEISGENVRISAAQSYEFKANAQGILSAGVIHLN